jgi:hypothetical protein
MLPLAWGLEIARRATDHIPIPIRVALNLGNWSSPSFMTAKVHSNTSRATNGHTNSSIGLVCFRDRPLYSRKALGNCCNYKFKLRVARIVRFTTPAKSLHARRKTKPYSSVEPDSE